MRNLLRHIAEIVVLWLFRKRAGQGGLALLVVSGVLAGCSDEQAERVGEYVTLQAQSVVGGYEEEGETRSFSPTRSDPTSPSWAPGYYLYDDLNGSFEGRKNLMKKSISAFFTSDGQTPVEGTFFYRSYDSTWQLDNIEVTGGSYFLYGFIPSEDAESATIAPNGSYSDGAVLTINGLNAVTPSDVCVIIGAKDGTDKKTALGLQQGHFATEIKTGESSHNYIFLLFDHLYSALRFSFTVDANYAQLRTIKLRKLELIAYSDDHGGGVKAKYDATITLRKNDAGTTPIEGRVAFTPVSTSANVAPVPLYEWDGDAAHDLVLSTTEPADFMGCFVPGDHVYFKLRSTYDVYDRQKNLIREHCQAENSIDLRTKFGSFISTTRGHSYSYTIKVQPTYLYVLSEPDLDNPTVEIEN